MIKLIEEMTTPGRIIFKKESPNPRVGLVTVTWYKGEYLVFVNGEQHADFEDVNDLKYYLKNKKDFIESDKLSQQIDQIGGYSSWFKCCLRMYCN